MLSLAAQRSGGSGRERGFALLAKGVLCRQESGPHEEAKAVAPVIVPEAVPADCEPFVVVRGGAPSPDRVLAMAPLAPTGGCLPLFRRPATLRAADPVEEDAQDVDGPRAVGCPEELPFAQVVVQPTS